MTNDKMICECCGGKINPQSLICEYCGTAYKQDRDNFIRIETFQSPVDRLACEVVLDYGFMQSVGPEKASEIAIRKIAYQMAEGIIPMIKYDVRFDPMYCCYKYRGEIRAIHPVEGGKVSLEELT